MNVPEEVREALVIEVSKMLPIDLNRPWAGEIVDVFLSHLEPVGIYARNVMEGEDSPWLVWDPSELAEGEGAIHDLESAESVYRIRKGPV